MPAKWTTISLPNNSAGLPFTADTMILLTDGSVLIHHAENPAPQKDWLRYSPDPKMGYAAGQWSQTPITMTHARQFFSSGVLKDGRVFAIGGEYSDAGDDSPLGEIFDPVTNVWSPLNKPSTFNYIQGDIAASVLADGRVIMGAILRSRLH